MYSVYIYIDICRDTNIDSKVDFRMHRFCIFLSSDQEFGVQACPSLRRLSALGPWSADLPCVAAPRETIAVNPWSLSCYWYYYSNVAVCQNLVPLVNIKIAGKWMFIPLKTVSIGIDPYPCWKGTLLKQLVENLGVATDRNSCLWPLATDEHEWPTVMDSSIRCHISRHILARFLTNTHQLLGFRAQVSARQKPLRKEWKSYRWNIFTCCLLRTI